MAHQDNQLKNAVVNVLYKVGSVDEQPDNTGLAHFLEHMMFEGSENYEDFDGTLQSLMGENNAFTTQDYTCYYESFPTRYLSEILKIEADRLSDLNLEKEKIGIQKKVILEEFKETSLNPPLADAWHYLQDMCFKNSYGWPVIGKKLEHIKNLKDETVLDFYKKKYQPSNVIVSIVSELEEDKMIEEASAIFSKSKLDITQPSVISFEEKDKTLGSKILKRKNISSPHFFLALHIADYGTKDYFIADMVSDLLTNGESSLLYKKLITDLNLCSEINSYTTDNKSHNLLIIEGKLNPNMDFDSLYKSIDNCFQSIKLDGISELKFETLINKALTYWAFNNYNTTHFAQNMAVFKYCNHVENPIDYINQVYDTIDKADIERFVSKFLSFENFSKLEYIPVSP